MLNLIICIELAQTLDKSKKIVNNVYVGASPKEITLL